MDNLLQLIIMIDITTYLNEIQAAPNIDTQIANYLGTYPNLFPQLNIYGGPNRTTRINLEGQNRLQVRWLDEHLITRRIEPWKNVTVPYLLVVLYNLIPIIIIRNTDNREDRYSKALYLNKRQHSYAAAYLFEFLEADPGPELEIYDTIGTFSGDVQPHISSLNTKYYDTVVDEPFLTEVLQYTIQYNY